MPGMDILKVILGHWCMAALIVAAYAHLFGTQSYWIFAWNAAGNQGIQIPEQCWTYDAHDLKVFAKAAQEVRIGRHSALNYYVNIILSRSDISFAIALAAVTALFSTN
jgi:hypothetical protein